MRAPNPDDFAGSYQIRQGSIEETGASTDPSADPRRLVDASRTMTLAPSAAGASTGDVLDLTLLDADGTVVLGPLPCRYEPEPSVLYHRTRDYEGSGQPFTIQVSLYGDEENGYRSIYGVMVFGDPENVGVWGADETGG